MSKTLFHLFLYLFFSTLSFAQSITTTGQLSEPRAHGESQLLYTGKVLFFGGYNGNISNPVTYKTTEVYNPSTALWSTSGDMNRHRRDFASVLLNDGRVIAIGGQDDLYGYTHPSCESYNISTDSWSYIDSLNLPRYGHKAVRLKDGRILIAGGLPSTRQCEIYDPSSNSWDFTGSMNEDRDDAISLTLLEDGRVLAVGSALLNSKTAEIYDPLTETWSYVSGNMIAERKRPQTILLDNGKVLIFGNVSLSDQNTSEIFDPATNSFTSTGSLAEGRVYNNPVRMDDGRILVFGLGDWFNPSDTKCIEVYNPSSGSWTTNTYNIIGTQGYSIHKLNDGKILISGGANQGGSSGSKICYLIDQNIAGPCSAPSTALSVNGEHICFGKDASISILSSESGVSYQGLIGGSRIGNPVTGGGDIQLTISAGDLAEGINIVEIEAIKSGCPAKKLTDTARVTSNVFITKPTISYTGSLIFCQGDSITFSAPAGFNNYLWSNGETASSIKVKIAGTFKVKVFDVSGCSSNWSENLETTVKSLPAVSAGSDTTACLHSSAFNQSGYAPGGGSWSGTFITNDGLFDPSLAGVGMHVVEYTATDNGCSNKDVKIITVNNTIVPTIDIALINGTNPAASGDELTFEATSTNGGSLPQFQWRVNDVNAGTNSSLFTTSGLVNNSRVSCLLISNQLCANPATVSSDTITMQIIGPPVVVSTNPDGNETNVPSSTSIKIKFSDLMNSSSAGSDVVKISGSYSGSHSIVSRGIYSGAGTDSIQFTPQYGFKPGELITVNISKDAESQTGLSLSNGFQYQYITEAANAPANFVRMSSLYFNTTLTFSGVADLDNDGDIDFAGVNNGVQSIYMLFNNGNAAFSSPILVNTGKFCRNLHISDLDQDGDADFIVCHPNDNSISIWLNDGSAGFTTYDEILVGAGPAFSESGDIDGDGDLDILVVNSSSNTISILLNDASGNFLPLGTISSVTGTSKARLHDLDNDGDLDLVTNTIIRKNDGDGNFTGNTTIGLWRDFCLSDFNYDGYIDMAVVGGTTTGYLHIYLNNTSGTLTYYQGYILGANSNPNSIATTDFDGDGDMDLVSSATPKPIIWLNNGTGSFSFHSDLPSGTYSNYYSPADLDGDNDMDIITPIGSNSGGIMVLLNRMPIIESSEISNINLCAGDSLTVPFVPNGYFSPTNTFSVQLSDPSGSFTAAQIIGTGSSSPVKCKIPVSSVEGSQYRIRVISDNPSVIGSDYTQTLFISENCRNISYHYPEKNGLNIDSNQIIKLAITNIDPVSVNFNSITVNGSESGLLSISGRGSLTYINDTIFFAPLISYKAGERITVSVNDQLSAADGIPVKKLQFTFLVKSGAAPFYFISKQEVSTNEEHYESVSIDLDSDNDLDIVTSNYISRNLSVFTNDGLAGFTRTHVISTNTFTPNKLTSTDFDSDGDMDIACTGTGSNCDSIFFVINQGNGDFSNTYFYRTTGFFTSYQSINGKIKAQDVNIDGKIDLVLDNVILLNDGSGNFTTWIPYPALTLMQLFDYDNDGDADIAGVKHGYPKDTMLIMKNDGNGNFSLYKKTALNHYDTFASFSADFDNDQDIDFAVTNYVPGYVMILKNDGEGGFIKDQVFSVSSDYWFLSGADFDGDGDMDLTTGGNYYKIYTFVNNGNGVFATDTTITRTYSTWNITCGDYDSDGDQDMVTISRAKILQVHLNGYTIPQLTTTTITGIQPVTALSGGNITLDGGAPVTERGVCWSTSPSPTVLDSKTSDGTGTGSFTSSLTGLNSGTTYYVRAYATNSVGTAYGNEVSFSTTTPTLPTVTTSSVTGITAINATSGGNVTNDGSATVTARGICWSISSNPTITDNVTTNGSGTGSFSSSLTGLSPNTTYYVRAYATNSVGTQYGNQISFTTPVEASLNSSYESQISVYPNPANGIVTLEIEGISDIYEIKILNSNGIAIFSRNINVAGRSHREAIDLSLLSEGLYTIQCIGDKGVFTDKLIISR